MELKRVVVTGLGAITPLGKSVSEFWDNLLKGVSGSGLITRFDATKHKTKFACEIKDYDVTQYFERKESRKLDPYAQYALIAADQAIVDSKLDLDVIDKDRAGVIWASGIGGIDTLIEELRGFFNGDETPRFSPFFIPKMISDIASGHISMKYGFCGPNFSTVSACASSTNAIIDAFNLIRLGKAEVFITGGSEAAVNPAGVGGFNAMMAMSTNNDEYKTASRPFDASRDGFVMGEGGCALILEEYEHAIRRGANIYAEVIGGGMSADAYHLTAPHPDGIGASKVMKNALEDAGISPEEVDYINVHGTATPLGDVAELKGILRVFGEHSYKLNISATKSTTGHLLGAAGAIESLAAILAVKDDIVPPSMHVKNLDPEIDPKLNLTLDKAQKRTVNVAISNTFGFGGHNSSIVVKKYQK
jgi:3-oxoacyl-[acyl-carrier-protein] synthase II